MMSEGKRFSQVYLDKGSPVNDSVRMRNRLSAFYRDNLDRHTSYIVQIIHRETGAKVRLGYERYIFTDFIEKCDICDLLDSITLIFQYLQGTEIGIAGKWHMFVTRVFKEENVGYRLDKKGGVHFFIDQEFEHNKSALLAGLSSQPAVQGSFEKAYSFLDQDPPDTDSAIKSMFESLEILYKHIIKAEGKDRLNSNGVQKKLKPMLQQVLSENPVASQACDHMMDSLCDWIDAGHMYRHGQNVERNSPPPIEFAVLFITQGTGFIRFLLPLA
jgi:hypothetical protein